VTKRLDFLALNSNYDVTYIKLFCDWKKVDYFHLVYGVCVWFDSG